MASALSHADVRLRDHGSMTSSHPLAEKAFEVIRLVGHLPERFQIVTEVPEEQQLLGIVVRRKDSGVQRVYAIDSTSDWAFELETDLKGGYFGPN